MFKYPAFIRLLAEETSLAGGPTLIYLFCVTLFLPPGPVWLVPPQLYRPEEEFI